MNKFDKRLGSILVKARLITQEAMDDGLAAAEKDSKSLTEVLVGKKTVDEKAVIGCIAEEMNLPPIDLTKVEIDKAAMELIPEDLANYYTVLPVAKIGKALTLAVANPFDILTLDDIKIVTGCELLPVVSSDVTIKKGIQRAYNKAQAQMEELFAKEGDADKDLVLTEKKEEEADAAALAAEGEEAPVVKLVNLMILQAIREGASDIHIEPFEKHLRVRYRVDGACHETVSPPLKMHSAIVSRIKIMSEMDIAERRRPQDGKFQMKVQGRQIDFRVSILPMIHGEKVVIRVLDTSALALSLDSLGFEEKALKDFRKALASPYGMILVTGPTGSGKSTTLYSAVKEVLNIEDNITTVEDPVEYQLDGVNQVPVSEKRGLTFAAALRSILRQDPDTVMIGEIRDRETIEIAVKAALTGHLVFSTLHTNDAPSTVTRMVDMGVEAFLVGAATVLIAAQRLGRKVCSECKEPVDVPEPALLEAGCSPDQAKGAKLFRAKGCSRCAGGYKGRFALLETMPLNEELRRVISTGANALEIKREAIKQQMLTLRQVGLANALRGKTSLEEVVAITMEDK
ncbi:MAG TPA: ATPase, T2SS/T4P/T4SS family [Planctomycetota bacterium]|nr:ATPase, T2SS/T4P/T4SS family [Planctomycetota bacterium]